MGTAYKIRCRHCGAQFEHHMQPGYGVLPVCVGCGEYVETETAIRCPACHKKLNTTQEEFNDGIHYADYLETAKSFGQTASDAGYAKWRSGK